MKHFDFEQVKEDMKKASQCEHDSTIEKEKGPHTGIYCASCDKWLRWKKKEPDYEKDWVNFTMPFGKHEGKLLKEIPHHYLKWGAENLDDDIVVQKMLAFALQKLTKKKARSSFPPVNSKDIYQLVDNATNEVLLQSELENMRDKAKEVWPKYVMPHPGFIIEGDAVVGRLEFVKKAEKKKKAKVDHNKNPSLFD